MPIGDKAIRDLTHSTLGEEPGLIAKYIVLRITATDAVPGDDEDYIVDSLPEGVELVTDFTFVLKPGTDAHARVALAAYAQSVFPFDKELARDLVSYLEDMNYPPMSRYSTGE